MMMMHVKGVTGERGGGGAAERAELRPYAAEEGRRLVERPRQLLLVPLQHPAVGVLHAVGDVTSHVITTQQKAQDQELERVNCEKKQLNCGVP